MVPSLIDQLFREIKEEKDAIRQSVKVHFGLLMIHPFKDGNGRTARLLASLMLLNSGFKSALFTSVEQHFYYNPQQYITLLSDYRLGKINKEEVCKGFAYTMYMHSYHACFVRNREKIIIDYLIREGISESMAWKTIYDFDTGKNYYNRIMRILNKYFTPLYKINYQNIITCSDCFHFQLGQLI